MLIAVTFTTSQMIGVAIIAFVVGFAMGYLAARHTPRDDADIRLQLATFIVLIWAISVLASIFIADYETSIWIHAIMGGICGYLFGIDNPLTGAGGSNG